MARSSQYSSRLEGRRRIPVAPSQGSAEKLPTGWPCLGARARDTSSGAQVGVHSGTLAQGIALPPDERYARLVRPPAAYLSGSVFRKELPILLVTHDDGGDWGFFDGGQFNVEDGFAVHIHHVFDEHPEVRLLADLPEGWAAERTSEEGAWERFPQPDEWKS